jgi:mRNA-degrading endonuclease toxin of MazEF toxin-antitoxin module
MRRPVRVTIVLLALAACSDPSRAEPFTISVKVEGDPGKPIAGASVARASRALGTTNAEGRATLQIGGAEGEIADVTVTCPQGFQSPPKPLSVRLTRFAEKSKIPEYVVACPPSTRRVVVAVRADNGPNLPVMYLDRPVTRTDAAGAASFALEVPPGAQFTVSLGTAERPDLKPIDPSKLFVVGAQDEVFLFDQRFDVEKKKPPPPPPGPRIPRHL